MNDIVMGHEVLFLLQARRGEMKVDALRLLASETFGSNALFGNCHGDTFDFDGLLGFLAAHGKISVVEGKVALGFAPSCSHP